MSTAWDAGRDGPGGRPAKGFEDYFRALRRRWWILLLSGALIGGGGTAFTFLQRPIYLASSRVLIEPPRAIVQGMGEERTNHALAANFFNTRVQMIASRQIAERVMNALHLSDWEELHGVEDPIAQLQGWLLVKPVLNSNLVDIAIEGSDPELVAKIVNSTVEEFLRYEHESLRDLDQQSRSRIEAELRGLEGMVQSSKQALGEFHQKHPNFLTTGESVESARLGAIEEARAQAEIRVEAARREVERFEAMRKAGVPWLSPTVQTRNHELREQLRKLDEELNLQRQILRPERFESDKLIRSLQEKRDQIARTLEHGDSEEAEVELRRLQQEVKFAEADLAEINRIARNQHEAVLGQRDQHAQVASLLHENQRHETYRNFLAQKKLETDILQGLTTPRIQVIDRAVAPLVPVRPIKELQIPLFIAGGLVLGGVLVLMLEFMDRSIRRPEHATAWLDWPLLGVIPKLRRRELVATDGRLRLAQQVPGTPIFESFRSLRTSLLAAQKTAPLRSVLVTSALAGEGKSVIAANLAVACARAGERVLLIEMDLRGPSLCRLFLAAPTGIGLTDVLRGEVDWHRASVATELANLSVLPAGDAGGIPLDVLGTVEMYDLLQDAMEQFDRVILDAPAILGLADARVVSQFADGILFVVHAGARDHRPLVRARQLFEQEGLRPIGFVFNGLRDGHEDLANASRRGPVNRETRSMILTPVSVADGTSG